VWRRFSLPSVTRTCWCRCWSGSSPHSFSLKAPSSGFTGSEAFPNLVRAKGQSLGCFTVHSVQAFTLRHRHRGFQTSAEGRVVSTLASALSESVDPHDGRASAPDFAGRGCDELELAPLLVDCQQVAGGDGGEAALRADREILERDVARGFVDAAAKIVL